MWKHRQLLITSRRDSVTCCRLSRGTRSAKIGVTRFLLGLLPPFNKATWTQYIPYYSGSFHFLFHDPYMVVSLNYCSQNGGNVYRAPYYNGNPNIGPRIIGN